MATATATAPTITTPRPRRATNPNAKRLERTYRLWADALTALAIAADACDALARGMGELSYPDSLAISGEEVADDAHHTAWTARGNLGLLESNAPHAVTALVRDRTRDS
jgi:hypothetical protein